MMNLKRVLTSVVATMIICIASLYAQGDIGVIQGVVVDQDGEPMIGASVLERGTTIGTATSYDGSFQLRPSSESAELVISFMGYKSVVLNASSPELAKVVLISDAQQLDDVVVIGYGTQRKDDMTGSVSVTKAEEINRGAVTSPQQMMQGKVAGLLVTPGDGGPGSSSSIRIRGSASLNASNDPLIVIDGIPVSNSTVGGMPNMLSSINPNDIESFTILKDASATAIYGSRASNGVVIITTKRGSSNRLNVSYSSSYSLSQVRDRIDVMSGDEYRSFMQNFYPEGTTEGNTVRSLMGTASTNWQDLIYRDAFATDQNVSIYGTVNNWLPYRASVGYTNEDGTLIGSNMERTTLNLSLNPKLLNDHLTFNINAKGLFSNSDYANSGAVGAAAFFDPTQDPYFRDADGNIDYSLSNGFFNWYGADGNPNTLANENPLTMLRDSYSRGVAKRFIGNFQADYKFHFLPELRANINVGLDRTWSNTIYGTNAHSFGADKDTDAPGLGKYTNNEAMLSNEVFEGYLSYAKEFANHRFDVMGGYSWQHFYNESDDITKINETNAIFNDATMFASEYYLVSFFGRANYSYKGRYLFTATLRNDASSRFAKDVRWGLFPSAALGWNVRQEEWLKYNRTVSDLKLRASWGLTGQQDIGVGDYPYLPRYVIHTNPGTSYPIDGTYTYVLQPQAYNPNVKWETTETFNVGLDYGFMNNRIRGSFDAYYRNTYDMLNITSVALGSNFSNTVIDNIGNMRNKGLEFAINATAVQTRDFSWDLGFNATWQDTKITKLTAAGDTDFGIGVGGISAGGTGGTIQIHKEGYSPYTFYAYKQLYDDNGKPLQNQFADLNNDGLITEADRYITNKSATPDMYYGINMQFRYRNWDLGINGHGSVGNYMFNDFYASNSSPVGNYINQGFLSNVASTVNKSGFTEANNSQQNFSDMYIESASFFRLDDLNLGYTFNNVGKSKLRVRTALSAQNLFVLSGYSGLDPESNGGSGDRMGIDNTIWPRPRTYTLRLNIDF